MKILTALTTWASTRTNIALVATRYGSLSVTQMPARTVGNAPHSVFICPRWKRQRNAAEEEVGRFLTAESLVTQLVYSEENGVQ